MNAGWGGAFECAGAAGMAGDGGGCLAEAAGGAGGVFGALGAAMKIRSELCSDVEDGKLVAD